MNFLVTRKAEVTASIKPPCELQWFALVHTLVEIMPALVFAGQGNALAMQPSYDHTL